MSLRRSLQLLSFVFCTGSSLALAQENSPVLLRYRFEPGQIVRYSVTLQDDYRITMGAVTDEPYSHQDSTKYYRVKSVAKDGSAELELAIEGIQIEIFQNGNKHNFKTGEAVTDATPAVFTALNDLVGQPHLRLTASPRGEISNYKPLVAKDQVPQDPSSLAFDVLLKLPEQAVSVGETWKEEYEVPVFLAGASPTAPLKKSVRMQHLYTLQSHTDGLATIEIKTKVLSVIEDPEEEMQLLRRTPQGSVVIDTRRGLMVSKSLSQNNQVSGFEKGASLINFRQRQEEKLLGTATAQSGAAIRK